MHPIGVDIGTNYTKITADGRNVLVYPSIVAYGEEKDWSLKGETKSVYVGDEALSIVQSMENVEVLRPLYEGRVLHESYLELARYGLKKIGSKEGAIIATGLPVKSSRKEREELKKEMETELKAQVLIFPEPVGTMAYMGIETGVCVDIGFGTTDVLVIADMEFLKGDTMLMGVDKLYENLEVAVRNRVGISITPEEMTKLLTTEGFEIGRIRGGKKVSVSRDEIMPEYEKLLSSWVERIANRVKLVLEGLSTMLIENFTITGGGSLLPGVYEMFQDSFADIGEIKRPDDPLRANSVGYYLLAKAMAGENAERKEESDVEILDAGDKEVKKGRKSKK
ncbi:rod shape-determining protein [Archaeoglobus neptunius]|uniref:rod shape-determining protein n=1 Tax=Archaeoglobus neptunius TaxID=2798580 RepID=UPI00192946CC|nr:rod shape-determining protein [Archaeoglobus neptunius]